jgi:hypothetical protein
VNSVCEYCTSYLVYYMLTTVITNQRISK